MDTDRDEIIRFAKKHFFRSDENSRWNGRQIYNAFKTAIALAEFEKQTTEDNINSSSSSSKKKTLPPKPVLTASHLRQVALVAKKFDEYLLETQGGETTAAMNQQHKVRADAFGLDGAPAQQKLKRRPTKNRMLDLDELPSTSEEDSDGSDDVSASSDGEEEEETEYEERKKSKRKGESSSKKGEDKKKSRKSKKSSKKPVDDDSDASS